MGCQGKGKEDAPTGAAHAVIERKIKAWKILRAREKTDEKCLKSWFFRNFTYYTGNAE